MQMSIIIIVLEGRRQGKKKKKQTHLWAGNVVQVFGFKNNFLREAGYYGMSRNFLCPSPKGPGSPNSNF